MFLGSSTLNPKPLRGWDNSKFEVQGYKEGPGIY